MHRARPPQPAFLQLVVWDLLPLALQLTVNFQLVTSIKQAHVL